MLFTADALAGIASGDVTVTFRAWKRPQARAGGRYRVAGRWDPGGLMLEVDRVEQIGLDDITPDEARRAGFPDREALVAELRRRLATPGRSLWRVEFRCLGRHEGPYLHERADLSEEDLIEVKRRLDRLDRVSKVGPWTVETLRLIALNPGVVSTELASRLGRERFELKEDIRKLKRLGLTISLERGYRLSPRGRAVLDRL